MFISKLSPEQWAEARRMRADGATYDAIGGHFGVSPRTVASRSWREGWPLPAGANSPDEGQRAVATLGKQSGLEGVALGFNQTRQRNYLRTDSTLENH